MLARINGRNLSGTGTAREVRRGAGSVKLVSENHAPLAALQSNEFAGSERRRIIRLEDYWLSLRRCAQGPFFEDFRPSRNPVPWGNCFIACFSGLGSEPTFDHVGRSIIVLFKPDRTNLPDREWLMDTIALRFGEMSDALMAFRPVRRDDSFDRSDGIVALYRSILLPFVDSKRKPTYVIGAVTCLLRGSSAN